MTLTWSLEKREISDLQPHGKNARSITKKQLAHLQDSLNRFGLIDKPIVNLDGTIIAGHQRIHILSSQGTQHVDCWVPSEPLTQNQVDELNIRHNKNTGSWDYDILANEWEKDLLVQWGFTESQLFEEEAPKAKKAKATFEFDGPEQLAELTQQLEEMANRWGAKLKMKI